MTADGLPRLPIVRLWRHNAALPACLAGVLVLLWIGGDPVLATLRYERWAIAHGEPWRLLTGNLVHANGRHLLLNLAGLGLVTLLFPGEYSCRQWLLIGVAGMVAVAAGLWWGSPEVEWYVGLSGVLHGLLAAGAIAWWGSRLRGLAVWLMGILIAKLLGEHWFGAVGWSGDLTVIVDAHLYGAVGGTLAGAILSGWRRHTGVPPDASGPV
jgi:rhomboid family GlyGly-CTERM serine protease